MMWVCDNVVSQTNKLLIGVGLLLGLGAVTVFALTRDDLDNGDAVFDDDNGDNGIIFSCEQELQSVGVNPRDLGEIQVFCPPAFSLIKTMVTLPLVGIPVTGPPKNPIQNITIKALDRCAKPLRNVNITLSQSTNQWGGFKVSNQNIVSCIENQPIFKTNSQGEVRIRYMAHHNPGLGGAQSVIVFINASKDGVSINESCPIILNGAEKPSFPFDPDRTREALKGVLTWAGCPGV